MGREGKSGFFAPLGLGNFPLDGDGTGATSTETVTIDDFGIAVVEIDAVLEQNFTEIGSAIALKSFSLCLYFNHSNSPQLDVC